MQRRSFQDKALPLLGLGTMRFPVTDKKTMEIDGEKAKAMIDYALNHGVNYIDTAYMYHNDTAEGFLGEALKPYDRSSYLLATKMPVWQCETPKDTERIFADQLHKLQTDYFDFYLCHNLTAAFFDQMEKVGVFDFLLAKQKEGVIKHIGFSFHDTPEVLARIVKAHPWEFAQIQCNYIDWELQDAKNQYRILAEAKIPTMIMEPVRGGALATLTQESSKVLTDMLPQKSLASWALRYVAELPNVVTVLSGMSDMAQLKDNVETMAHYTPLSPQEKEALKKAREIFRKNKTIPCTGCRYCMDCKQGVDIPALFALANGRLLGGSDWTLQAEYEALKRSARETSCTSCGNCMEHCPQNINIPEELERVGNMVQEVYDNA